MSSIWFRKEVSVDELQSLSTGTMAEYLGMKWEEIGKDFLRMTMTVTDHVKQPYGLLHGGASCALAETIGSVGSHLLVDPEQFICVGMEINANHVRSVKQGKVFAIAKPMHYGRSSHIWDIKISDDRNQLVCISRLTVAILKKESGFIKE